MPSKRRVDKARKHRITPAAVAAYRARDVMALHTALGLKPWEVSPLAEHALGCNQGPAPTGPGMATWNASWGQAQELQRELEAAIAAEPPKA